MKKRNIIMALCAVMLLSGCADKNGMQEMKTDKSESKVQVQESKEESQKQSEEERKEKDSTEKQGIENISEWFSDRDFEIDYQDNKSAKIELLGNTASCSSDAVQISEGVITIIDEGTYILSGTLDNGMVVVRVDKKDKVQLVLDNATIHSKTLAPIYIAQADKVFVTLASESENMLSNGGSFEAVDENNIDSVIFSKDDLTINGFGKLSITSPAGHGIVSKDELTITGGTYEIETASHGITGKDNVCIADGTFSIVSGKDGIHAENSDDTELGFVVITNGVFDILAQGDGISASSTLQILDGTFEIVAGGGSENATPHTSDMWGGGFMGGGRGPGQKPGMQMPKEDLQEDTEDSVSMKGIKAAQDFMISGGNFVIDSADDAIHSNTSVNINGGILELTTGDDGIHADENLTISDGIICITESYEGLEGLHVLVEGGDITLTASDDGINAAGGNDQSGYGGPRGNDRFGGGASNGSIIISGGNVNITASGDGIDANGSLKMIGGMVVVCGPSMGDTATLDYDISATITGGTFIGTGASQMAQTFSNSKQGVIAINAGKQTAESLITLVDEKGNTLITHEPKLDYSVVIISTPEIVTGKNYTITVGSSSGEVTAD